MDVRRDFHVDYLLLVLINILFTAGTMFLAKSILFPTHNFVYKASVTSSRTYAARPLLVLTEATSSLTSLTYQRSYVSGLQIWAFLAAVVCLDNGRTLQTIFIPKRGAVDSSTLLDRSLEAGIEDYAARNLLDAPSLPSSSNSLLSCRSFLIAAFTVTGTWVLFLSLNFSKSIYPKTTPTLDLTYVLPVNREVVISMY